MHKNRCTWTPWSGNNDNENNYDEIIGLYKKKKMYNDNQLYMDARVW